MLISQLVKRIPYFLCIKCGFQ